MSVRLHTGILAAAVGAAAGLVVRLAATEVPARVVTDVLPLLTALVGVMLVDARSLRGQVREAGRRLEAERASRARAEQRFDQALAAAPTAMLLVAPDGRITRANEQAEHALGYDARTLCAMRVEELIPAESRAGHAAHRRCYARDSASRPMGANRDLFALHRDGHRVPVEIGLTSLDTDDGPMVLAMLIDLTARRAKQSLEARAEALERSNRELDDFAYAASHDLRAPLRGIEQLAGFIMEDAGERLPPESREDLALLRGRVARMEGLLEGLLQYSRIGRREGEPEWLDTVEVVSSAAELCVPSERFEVETEPELPPVYAPRAAVELVFRNLLANAVKHHDRERGVVRVGWQADDEHVWFTVADDGPGIPYEFKDKVFQPLQTLHARDDVESSGMGLALVRKTIEAHGGTVELCPGEGRGATFRLCWGRCEPTRSRAA